MNKSIDQAVEILNQGGIVIFPTDTAFGIGCKLNNKSAVEKLFRLRKRPVTKPTPVLIDTVKMAKEITSEIPIDVVNNLIEPFWPGALTIILNAKIDKMPKLVRGGGNSVGLRIPNHKTTRKIIRSLKSPILGPSANFHGEKTPYSLKDLDKKLIKLVDFVVEGECTVKKPSTVIDCTKTPWEIIRKGAVDIKI